MCMSHPVLVSPPRRLLNCHCGSILHYIHDNLVGVDLVIISAKVPLGECLRE